MKKIKEAFFNFFKSGVIGSFFARFRKPVYHQEITKHPDRQVMEYKCFKNGKYTHTVDLHYFTKEQIDELQQVQKNLQ